MMERIAESVDQLATTWGDLGIGAPTIIALAQLCSRAIVTGPAVAEDLSPEAKAILFTAGQRGILEIRGSNTAYESPSRLLTVFVELDSDARVRFRDPGNVEQNVRFLEGFRQLCAHGLVMHHLFHEFTLTAAGFLRATSIHPDEIHEILEFGQPCGPG
ncbi:MAG: hypothetical protein ACYC0X_00200 [Pirellulaceae bacterium]